MTTAGDMIDGGTAGAPQRLAIGTSGQVLTVQSGAPAWAAATGFTNPMTTAGDLIYGGTAGAATRLAVGTPAGDTGQFLGVTSGAPAWQQVSGQFLCVPTSYAPASQTPLTVTGTSWAAFSSANVNTGAFTAPPSGSVIVTLSCMIEEGTTSQAAWFALATHGSTTPICNAQDASIGTAPVPYQVSFVVTGLTAGTSYTLDPIGACGTAGDTVIVAAYGSNTVSTTRGAPVVLMVQAV